VGLQNRVNQEPQADTGKERQSPCTSGQAHLSSSMTVAWVIYSTVTMRHIHSDKSGPSPSSEVKPLDQHQVVGEQ